MNMPIFPFEPGDFVEYVNPRQDGQSFFQGPFRSLSGPMPYDTLTEFFYANEIVYYSAEEVCPLLVLEKRSFFNGVAVIFLGKNGLILGEGYRTNKFKLAGT